VDICAKEPLRASLAAPSLTGHLWANAKAEGKYKGRLPTARAKSEEVIALFKANGRPSEIARSVEIGRVSVYRILNGAGLI
jgi:DNA invertase Pin-like site-specific DNA recombinase